MMFLAGRLSPLWTEIEPRLEFVPQDLAILEVVIIIFRFILRQFISLFGLDNEYTVSDDSDDRRAYFAPANRLSMPFRVSKTDVSLYTSATRLENQDQIFESRAQTCLFLAALSEPAMLLLLAHRQSPVKPLGAVNVRNELVVLKPQYCTANALSTARMEVRAEMLHIVRPVKRGLEVDLQLDIVNLDVDEGQPIFRQVFTLLQFTKVDKLPSEPASGICAGSARSPPQLRGNTAVVDMKISQHDPVLWARVCKDYNPIHISNLAAKIFGFRAIIAHGNHALALAVAALSRGEFGSASQDVERVKVEFHRPIVLPKSLTAHVMQVGEQSRSIRLLDKQNEKCHLTALLE